MRIPLAHIGLRQIDIDAAISVLNSGQLTMGAKVAEFEKRMASYLGTKHFVMVNSGSSANLLMIEALLRPSRGTPKLKQGDCVLVPAIAWPTTIWPLIQLGLNPIFVDVEMDTLSINLGEAQSIIDNSGIEIKAIFPIHVLGRAIPRSKLESFAEKNDLILINDVCESLGSWSEGKHAGNVGIASSYSFYFSHHITTMEGGGISTDDSSFCDDLRSMRSHGWSRDRSDSNDWTKDVSENDSKFLFVSTGYNVRPTELQAALGISQIADIDKFIERRRHIARRVSETLDGTRLRVIGYETLRSQSDGREHSWMLLPIVVEGQNALLAKKVITEALKHSGIETRPVLTGNFLSQPAIKRITKNLVQSEAFQIATKVTESAFLVSAHHEMNDRELEYLCECLKHCAEEVI